ncbi:MAG: Lrp/AsnC family transcriptional regulator [Burkholderiales bacterium]|nr:Lrp/AsnC family transcriptional regulator [Burkholderiales bacterium]
MQQILDYLKQGGERLDSEIAAATGLSLASVRQRVKDLHAQGAVMVCRSIRYKDGKEIDAVLCRVAGYIPPAAPGRKSKAHAPTKSA